MAPERDPYSQEERNSALDIVVKAVEECERRYHDAFIEKVERRYRAYRGLMETDVEEGDWHSSITAPYVLQTCEGMLATMLEPHPVFDVRPRPLPEEPIEAIQERMGKADALQDVLAYALDRDGFIQKQRPFMQQDLIAGISVMKSYWAHEERDVTKIAPTQVEIIGAYGETLDRVYSHEEQTQKTVIKDDPCCEVRDVRDFFWPSQAPDASCAEYLIDRTWESYASCERKQAQGYYKNVAKLKDAKRPQGATSGGAISERELRLRNLDRTQDLVEILEYWTPERVITVGNRYVVLNDRPNPLWNGRMPFIVCSAVPDAFQIPGISVVEALAQLQEMLWTLQNQRLDALRMMANLITLIRSDVDDPDAFEWAPNAQWFVEDPDQVKPLQIDPTAATITLQAEALIKGDLQNIMGGLPYTGGADSGTIDQQTATGVSIITSIAQRLIQARKQYYLWSYADLGKQFLLLYQQFLRDDRVIKIVGPKGAQSFRSVSPLDVQGDFDVSIDVTSDSLLRQERRAEAQSLLQLAASIAPIAAQLGAPLNMKTFVSKVLDAYDVQNKDAFFMATPPPGMAPGAPQPGQPGQPGQPPPGVNGQAAAPPQPGITNVPTAAGQGSPSNANSMSAEAAMQRLMAMRGTPAGG